MQTFLYLSFGYQGFFDEVLFSILSLKTVAPNAPWRIVVYTDRPEFFSRLPDVEAISIPHKRVQEWMGSFDYFYRLKIQALRDCMERFGGNVIMLDGDTFFVNNPADTISKISPQTALMNGVDPGKHSVPACRRVIEASQDIWDELGIPNAPRIWRTWNSGVVGLHEEHKTLLDQALYVNDVLYVRSGIRIVEQVAISIVLQNHMQLVPMDTDIIHYFWAKKDFDQRLKAFMDENRDKPYDELIKLAAAFRPPLERDPKPTRKQKWRNSCNKRIAVIQFRARKFLYGKDWLKDTGKSRKHALPSDLRVSSPSDSLSKSEQSVC